MPDAPIYRVGPQAREPSKCLNGWSYGERLAKTGLLIASYKRIRKDSDKAITPVAEAVHVPVHIVPPGPLQPKQLHHLHAQLSLGQSCQRQKKVLHLCAQGHFGSTLLWPCRLQPTRLLCHGGGFSRQEYWSILANICFHTLLEHCISCCPSHQLP